MNREFQELEMHARLPRKRVSIVVPVFNNASSLRELMSRFQGVAADQPEDFEFVFVDDGSRDNSFAVLEELLAVDARVRVVKLVRNFGANAASSAGVRQATGDAVVAISADLQDPPELILQMLERWRAGYRLVLASRTQRDDPWLTRFTSRIYWRLFREYAVANMPENGCDYCLLDRQVIESLRDTHEPSGGVATLVWTGFEPALIEYERRAREKKHGRSGWTFGMRVKYMIDSFVSFSHMPVRAASMLGMCLAVIGVSYAAVLLYAHIVGDANTEPGYASLMVVLLVVSGVQLIMTGIFGEYLIRTLEAARRRPSYIVDRVLSRDRVHPNLPPQSNSSASAEEACQPDPSATMIEEQR